MDIYMYQEYVVSNNILSTINIFKYLQQLMQ